MEIRIYRRRYLVDLYNPKTYRSIKKVLVEAKTGVDVFKKALRKSEKLRNAKQGIISVWRCHEEDSDSMCFRATSPESGNKFIVEYGIVYNPKTKDRGYKKIEDEPRTYFQGVVEIGDGKGKEKYFNPDWRIY